MDDFRHNFTHKEPAAGLNKPTCDTEGQVLGIFLYQFIFIFLSEWLFIRRFISLFIQCFHLRFGFGDPLSGPHMPNDLSEIRSQVSFDRLLLKNPSRQWAYKSFLRPSKII